MRADASETVRECSGSRVDHLDGSWDCTRSACVDPADAHWLTVGCTDTAARCGCEGRESALEPER
ncbi:hypothetical protein LQF12_03415 [Ruania suaedae]|uniref:hypothetical protein n=1 Tax=Ruania suaedae TaxID=2897774 RepID=UPI001E38DA05|nr:hypothetical protein [Ruania suaedae]UFU03669.1 hypothetical protein LQF12_03415 [Ruania suaedae]